VYWVSGWIKASDKVTGGKLISLSFTKKEQTGVSGGVESFGDGAGSKETLGEKMNDEIPF
jgi:hypothetical protein